MNDTRRKPQRKQHPSDDESEVGDPQLFRSLLFRTVTWIVLILIAVSTIALFVMALRPAP